MQSTSSIALVTETWPPEINGVAMTLSHLARGLSKRHWQVTLVRPKQQKNEAIDTHQHLLMPSLPIPGYAGLRFGLPMKHLLLKRWSQQPPDVVHIATQGPLGWAAMKVAKRLNLPVTTSFHTNFQHYCGHYGVGLIQQSVARYLRKFHNQASCTMTPNEPLSQSLRQEGYQNVFTVGRAIDTELFTPVRRSDSLRAEWGATDALVVMYVGRMAAEKNLQGVAEAFGRIQAVKPNARMVWVGDGPQLKNMRERHPQHIFVGAKRDEDLATHYASADIFLFPSMTETFGNVVLEAMSSGLAVVAYDYAAAQHYIEHGESGLLAKFGDAADFNQQAALLAQHPERIDSIGQLARIALENTHWESVCDQFETLLKLASTKASS